MSGIDHRCPEPRGGRLTGRRSTKAFRGERAFTLLELVVALAIFAVLLTTAVVAIHGSFRRTDVMAATDIMINQINKVYSLAANAAYHPSGGGVDEIDKRRDRYRIEFHGSDSENPRNAYRIMVQEWNGTSWNPWRPWKPGEGNDEPFFRSAHVKSVEGHEGWYRPSTSASTVFGDFTGMPADETTGNPGITFEAKGSIVVSTNPGGSSFKISDSTGYGTRTITVSEYGAVSD